MWQIGSLELHVTTLASEVALKDISIPKHIILGSKV